MKDLVVVAENPAQMKEAQVTMIGWATQKKEQCAVEVRELWESIQAAERGGLSVANLKRAVRRARRRQEYYNKVHAALEAGFCIIPNFPVDVFAVRTTQKNPSKRIHKGRWATPDDTKTNSPPLGDGRYLSNGVMFQEKEVHSPTDKEPDRMVRHVWASDFMDVEFPIALAQASVIEATTTAMKRKIFDELGVLPERRRRGDPMIVGRIVDGHGYGRKEISFLVSWWIDTRDL